MLKANYLKNSVNCGKYLEKDGTVKPEAVETHPWLLILVSAEAKSPCPERACPAEESETNEVLGRVLRTLDVLDEILPKTDPLYGLTRTVLQWAQTAKCVSAEDRKRWEKRGYPLAAHSEASAMIYVAYRKLNRRHRLGRRHPARRARTKIPG